MNTIIKRRMADRKRRSEARLDRDNFPDDLSQPMLRGANVQFDLAGRGSGTAHGGLAMIHQLAQDLGLAAAIDQRLKLFKVHLPYHESDHVLNLAYNALCGGTCLEDLELRRQDEAYLNLLGAQRIPDPTTAGDFCRRFESHHLQQLHEAFDVTRRKVWSQQPTEFFAEARIEADGIQVQTYGECKQGIDLSYKGVWGYHPLVLSLANTGEVLRLVNRSGNRPSHEGAAAQFDQCIALCRQAGFRRILLRGDTDFSQTAHLDGWHDAGDVRFVFGLDWSAGKQIQADDLPWEAWKPLHRPPKWDVQTETRAKPERFKQQVIEQRKFKDIQLIDEEVAEFSYRPTACKHTYRVVVVRKNLKISEPKQNRLFEDYKYFFYISNDWQSTPEQIVFSANDRCQQENVLSQLRASCALHAPVDTLLSNGAYMLMTALAWNLKAWLALSLPVVKNEKPAQRQAIKQRLLGMEFHTFTNNFLQIPAQVVSTGRRVIVRLLAWNRWQPIFFRLAARFSGPRRC